MIGNSGFHALILLAMSTVSRIIGPVTREMPRQSASRTSLRTRCLKLGVIVESISTTSKPARIKGVATARIPSGAVASVLENEGKKKTILRDVRKARSNANETRLGNAWFSFVTALSAKCHLLLATGYGYPATAPKPRLPGAQLSWLASTIQQG